MAPIIITQSGDYPITVPAHTDQLVVWIQTAASPTITSTVTLAGPGAHATIRGLFLLQESDHATAQFTIHHTTPNTCASFLAKGTVRDQAVADFTGLIKIDEVAQKTESFLEYRALLLDATASANPTPSLEILANDVVASHAATTAPIDREQLFYVQSRGIDQPQAEALLTEAFVREVMDQLPAAVQKKLSTLWKS